MAPSWQVHLEDRMERPVGPALQPDRHGQGNCGARRGVRMISAKTYGSGPFKAPTGFPPIETLSRVMVYGSTSLRTSSRVGGAPLGRVVNSRPRKSRIRITFRIPISGMVPSLDLAQRGTPDTRCFCSRSASLRLSLPCFPNQAADNKQHSSPLFCLIYKTIYIF